MTFDANGQCGACSDAIRRLPHEWWPGSEGEARMDALVAMLKAEGRGKPYDVMVGLSGGIGSAYLAHLMATRYGLRLLAIHVDGGWNSEPAVSCPQISPRFQATQNRISVRLTPWRLAWTSSPWFNQPINGG